jgi:hypothetical protein
MSTISVVDNKIKVIPSELVNITILKKVLVNSIITDIEIIISDSSSHDKTVSFKSISNKFLLNEK